MVIIFVSLVSLSVTMPLLHKHLHFKFVVLTFLFIISTLLDTLVTGNVFIHCTKNNALTLLLSHGFSLANTQSIPFA